eukprot:scaffold14703_cov50-Phaeocystis_antarctica.AAC.1
MSLGRYPPKRRADGGNFDVASRRWVLAARDGVARRMRADAMVAWLGLGVGSGLGLWLGLG